MKQTLRAEQRALRKQLAGEDIARWSEKICAQVETLEAFRRAKVVACYLALPHEVQTAPLLATCRRLGLRVCVPAYYYRAASYRLAWLTANDVLTPGRWQVPEPLEPVWVEKPEIVDLVLVPGLAFDNAGRRLGHGSGGFDRLLDKVPTYKIGLAFAAQMIKRVPVAEHDIPMDVVVTEEKIYPCAQRGARA